MAEVGEHPVVAHNDPSPARERVLRLFEEHHIPLNMVIALPSLDGIKRAVELDLGVALLPRRCAVTEIASKRLVAIPVGGVSRKREVTLVCRKAHRCRQPPCDLGAGAVGHSIALAAAYESAPDLRSSIRTLSRRARLLTPCFFHSSMEMPSSAII